jgi:hypothetical protein
LQKGEKGAEKGTNYEFYAARLIVLLILFCSVLVMAGCSSNDESADADETTSYTISGTISGDIVSSVALTLSGTSSGSRTTDSSAEYTFTITAGTYLHGDAVFQRI